MKNLSLAKKASIVIGILILACVGVSWQGLRGISNLSNEINRLVTVFHAEQMHWVETREHQNLLALQESELLTIMPENRAQAVKDLEDLKKHIEDTTRQFQAKMDTDDQGQIDAYLALLSRWWEAHKKVQDFVAQTGSESADPSSGNVTAANEFVAKGKELIVTTSRPVMQEMSQFVDNHLDSSKKAIDEDLTNANLLYSRTKKAIVLTAAGLIGFALVLSFIVLRNVRRSLDQIIGQLLSTSDSFGGASEKIASSSSGLSQATIEQAASLQETAASLEELTSMVSRNMESAKRAANVSGDSQTSANRGKEVVRQMALAIDEIDQSNIQIMTQVEEGNRQISDITKVIGEIGEKTKVINDIVFQTKLLSFNASVEAARAGEHGKGFAVVAEEVGNLAQMSGNAAKEINEMLQESIDKVDAIVNATKANVERQVHIGKEKVIAGTKIAEECNRVLDEIVKNVAEVTRMSNDISIASEEQAQGVQEINRAVAQLDMTTQTNSTTATETASSAESLSAHSFSMKDAVSLLVTSIRGRGAVVEAPVEDSNTDNPAVSNSDSKVVSLKAPRNNTAKSKRKESVVKAAKKSGSLAKKKPGASGGKAEVRQKKQAPPQEAASVSKKAAGSDLVVPSENDPRFQDV